MEGKREKAFDLYKQSGGVLTPAQIANLIDVPCGTVRGWKSKDDWHLQLHGSRASGPAPDGMTHMQREFVRQYIMHPCAAKAAVHAGYSEKNAGRIGYQLLRKPHVTKAVDAGLEEHIRQIREGVRLKEEENRTAVLKNLKL